MLKIGALEGLARRATRGHGGSSIAIIGCASEGTPAEWCPVDVVVFPEEEGQEIWRGENSIIRVIRARAPPIEEVPSMLIVDDPSMEAAALKITWRDRVAELARGTARRLIIDGAESTAKGIEALGTPAASYYAMKSYALTVAAAVAAAGRIPRPAHVVRQARALGVMPHAPPGELSHVKRTVETVRRILYSELDQEVEGYVFRRKAEALVDSGLLLDAMVLAFHEISRRIGDDLALAHLRMDVDQEALRTFLPRIAEEESIIWRSILAADRPSRSLIRRCQILPNKSIFVSMFHNLYLII